MDFIKKTWAEINLDTLEHNLASVRKTVSTGQMIMGVVKADAYGHGDAHVASRLAKAGVDWFGVSSIEEAIGLRCAGVTQPILILYYTPTECAALLAEHKVTQAIVSAEYAQRLQAEAAAAGVIVEGHMKLDTGMIRGGLPCDEDGFVQTEADIVRIASYPNLRLTGVFSHFAVADDCSADCIAYTQKQFARYSRMIAACEKRGIHFPIQHCANSATTLNHPDKRLDLVRVGILLYGMLPADDCVEKISVEPILTLKTTVGLVKHIRAGTSVSYGRTHIANRDSVIAVLPIGYADGYSRQLSNQGKMLIHGQYAPVVGRVCMDQLMIDVTDIPGVAVGDEVVVFGRQGENVISVEAVAKDLNTICYELTCIITKRVPRVYISNNEIVGVVQPVCM